MATALPHAPPTKAAFPTLKVPAASVPTKAAHTETGVSLKTKFQSLLEHAAQGPKSEPTPTAKTKVKAEATEKPKEAKKAETKDHKPETDTPWLAALQATPKAEAPKAEVLKAKLEVEVADKNKVGKDIRKPVLETAMPTSSASVGELRSMTAPPPVPKTERSEDKAKVFVVDRRTDKEKDKLKLPGAETAGQQPVNAAVELQTQAKTDAKAVADVQVTFQTVTGKAKDGFDLKPQAAQPSPRDAASFQQYLVERGYGQLVDQARIVLKDQNAGEIRMTLYPETLGKVKVALNLSDNSLAGQIYVENQTVKDVFQANMDGLMQAFRDGGWNDLSLQVSVGNGGGGQQPGNGQAPFTAQARDYDRQVTQSVTEGRPDRIGTWSDRQVNLTA